MDSLFSSQVFTVIMLLFQTLITIIGTVLFFMMKRVVSNIDQLAEEDKELRLTIYRHREDSLISINELRQEMYKMHERRQNPRG